MNKEIKAAISRIIDEYEEGTMSLATLETMLFQEIDRAPQPVSVIVPPIEWGEWEAVGKGRNRWKRSKCKRYDIHHDTQENEYSAFLDRIDSAINNIDEGTEQEAEEACQAHAQAKVNRALEGCNVIPYRDPQGLVDALNYTANTEGVDMIRYVVTARARAKDALKEWEDGK